LANTLSYNSKT